MKTQKRYLILFTIMIVNACSIEKKHASFGYHIEWRNNKFLNGNKAIDQKTKPKVAKEKAVIVPDETDLIMETNANAVVINQEKKSDIISTSNGKSKLINKPKNTIHFKIPITKESLKIIKKKLLFPIKRITKISDSFIAALIILGLGLLFFLIAYFAPPSKDLLIFYLFGTVLLLAGIISTIAELLKLLIEMI